MGEFVNLETDDGIGTIRLNRPPVNALNDQVTEELAAAARAANGSDEVRAVIVYGGEKVFAAGADITVMAEAGYAEMVLRSASLQEAVGLIAAKQAIDAGLGVDLATGHQIERVQFAALFGTEDQRAGMRSFLENGPGQATFTGR